MKGCSPFMCGHKNARTYMFEQYRCSPGWFTIVM